MKFRLATWNINSVRLRIGIVEQFVRAHQPDVLCLQEIKCVDELFPYDAVRAMGFPHIHVKGQAGYHGVAIASRFPMTPRGTENFCGSGEARHIAAAIEGLPVIVHNVYIPAGGDIPDPEVNPKFAQKLAYVKALAAWFGAGGAACSESQHILAGDFNIAPLEQDVWSHKQLLNVVSHTPVEVQHLARLKASADWVDIMRKYVPESEKLYTWWSYRARDWRASNRGRRLDHIWATPGLETAVRSMTVVEEARGWRRPSDHVPVIADFEIDPAAICLPATGVTDTTALSPKAHQPTPAGTPSGRAAGKAGRARTPSPPA
jgi:exodeoxyribonuclease-3